MKLDHKVTALTVCTLVAFVAFVMEHRRSKPKAAASTQEDLPASVDAFAAPYMSTNAGIPDSAAGFQSSITVNVNPDIAQYMTNKYMPLFGFVGMAR